MKPVPQYDFQTFVTDCVDGTAKAFVSKGAMDTAKSDFNLNTQEEVLAFIANDGLEKPQFINVVVWKNNKDKTTVIMVDAYAFFSGLLYGYIAFVQSSSTGKWIIKSFKKNEQPDPRNLVFKSALSNLLDKS